ncbi:hypothetical protein MW887_001747 [Aspergillus wentii]|nr:hypothetical protein MW887_001747 [Aspergillus wentii]
MRRANYLQGEARKIQNQKFYQSTVQAIEAQKLAKTSTENNNGAIHNVKSNQKPADEQMLKQPEPPKQEPAVPKVDNQEMEEISIAGRTKMQVPKNKDKSPDQEKPTGAQGNDEAKDELNGILKRSPIIIFSKSYCPHSARAKSILLDQYSIVPAPYVVELDKHPLGAKLQALLAENTGRRTVPNVLVNGKTIGGGDDVAALNEKDELASKLKTLGGKWIVEVNHK